MVKNDFLLRVLLFAGLFWITKPFCKFFGLFIGLNYEYADWMGIIGAIAFAYYAHSILFKYIEKSIVKYGEMSTTVRWLLYILVGLAMFTGFIALFNNFIYSNDPRKLMQQFLSGSWLEMLKAFGLLLLAFFGTLNLTRVLVKKITIQIAPNSSTHNNNTLNQAKPTGNSTPAQLRNKNDKSTIHGSAEFLPTSKFNQRYNQRTDKEMYQQFEQTGGYVIQPNVFKYLEHTHMITIAGSGQGKGTTAIIPNLLTRPQNSWVVLDVKGENAAVTARFQKETGQHVFIIDPFNVQRSIGATHGIPSSGFNPLIVGKYLPIEEISDFAAMIAEMFIPEANKNTKGDAFWTDSGRNLIKAYILHILTNKDIKDKHLGLLYEWLRLDMEGQVRLWVDMSYNELTKFAANEIQSLAVGGEKTWLGVLSEARRATAFLESPLIRNSFKSNDFDPMALQTSNTTAYIILPERNLNTHKTWLRIVFGTILRLCNFTAKTRVNFLMDEFPILDRMDDFLRAAAFGRGQKISCWFFAQSLSQLKDIYGEEGLNTLLANSTLRQFFGMNDSYTQEYVSKLLGETTEWTSTTTEGNSSGTNSNSSMTGILGLSPGSSGSGTSQGYSTGQTEQLIKRPLMTPEEVGKLRKQFILMVNGDKFLIDKYPYYHPNVYSGRYDPNPYVQ
ncbi:hypothetical protein A4D02_35440 [Niastella koreensis]|uniref:TRAG family protein n=2 Tax=Niastella koreensis TaxID=354356 RepID=G8TJG5_NIAKG|nr:type IV secretory system conjugative DNA transfer family protein [Niastella koreensis]AEV99700.1 TRAG family protein [Niastella koreensis GR20-10]OQP44273.1 hypothetical protein A4D02_35440 [Niastella koreensis]